MVAASGRFTLHCNPQDSIDPGLIPTSLLFQPIQNIGIEANGELLLFRRPFDLRPLKKGRIQLWNVGVVDIPILHPINPRQVAHDRFLAHAG